MSESYWWCANCKEEVDGSHVTYAEMHENCGHPVESITPEKQGRIAVLEDEMRFLNKARDSYLSQALNHGITIIKLKEDMKELEADIECYKEAKAGSEIRISDLEAELAKVKVELNLRREQMSRFPFCPDHRDKVHGKECRECEVEHLRGCLKRLEWAADGRCPVCGKPKSCGHRFDCWLAAETGGK